MDKIRTPIVSTLTLGDGTAVEVRALPLGLVRRASQAEGTEAQLALVEEIVNAVASLPDSPETKPADVLGIDDCNLIVQAATGTAPKADFPKP